MTILCPFAPCCAPRSPLYQGDSVYKVGAQSGTTGGTVIDTCTDVSLLSDGTMFTLLCAARVRLSAMGGDSGAPVLYRAYNGNTFVVGILSNGDGFNTYYSRWDKVDYELGARIVQDLSLLP